MGIKIKVHEGKWRIHIDDEEWQYPDRKSMEAGLKILLDMKETKGQLEKKRRFEDD